jgi:hypothetical protein
MKINLVKCWAWAKRVKLVGDNKMTELEELVKKANDGWEAICKLYSNYPDKTEAFYKMHGEPVANPDWQFTQGKCNNFVKFRIKKKEFTPFYVGQASKNNWKVYLEGEFLHIGCQKFNAKDLKNFLEGAIYGTTPQGQGFNCSKRGLYHTNTNNTLTWEDAEKILKAFEDHA